MSDPITYAQYLVDWCNGRAAEPLQGAFEKSFSWGAALYRNRVMHAVRYQGRRLLFVQLEGGGDPGHVKSLPDNCRTVTWYLFDGDSMETKFIETCETPTYEKVLALLLWAANMYHRKATLVAYPNLCWLFGVPASMSYDELDRWMRAAFKLRGLPDPSNR